MAQDNQRRRGLLGQGFDDPQTQFNLALASGLLGSRGSLGQALGQALPGAVGAQQAAARAAEGRQLRADEQARLQAIGQAITQTKPGESPVFAAAQAGGRPAELQSIAQAFPPPKAPTFERTVEGLDPRTGRPEIFAIGSDFQKRALGIEPLAKQPGVVVQTGDKRALYELGAGDAELANKLKGGAIQAVQGNAALGRIKDIITAPGGVSAGPLGNLEVLARNLASQMGVPIDKVRDANNARFSAESLQYIANQVLSGGRGISNDDRTVIRDSWPGFTSGQGVAAADLPAFVAQLEAMNQRKIDEWNAYYENIPSQVKEANPVTFLNTPDILGRVPTQREIPRNPDGTFADPRMEELYRRLDREGKLD